MTAGFDVVVLGKMFRVLLTNKKKTIQKSFKTSSVKSVLSVASPLTRPLQQDEQKEQSDDEE